MIYITNIPWIHVNMFTCCQEAAAAQPGSGLPGVEAQPVLGGHGAALEVLLAQELGLRELRDGDGDHLHDPRDPQPGQPRAGVGEEVVPAQDGDLVAVLQLQQHGPRVLVLLRRDVDGQVDHGLVDGLAGVDHLHDLRQLPLFLRDPGPGIHIPRAGAVTRGPRQQQHEEAAQLHLVLALVDEPLDGVQHGVLGPDQLPHVHRDVGEVVVHERPHGHEGGGVAHQLLRVADCSVPAVLLDVAGGETVDTSLTAL